MRVRFVRRQIDLPRHGRIRALRAADLQASIGRRHEHATGSIPVRPLHSLERLERILAFERVPDLGVVVAVVAERGEPTTNDERDVVGSGTSLPHRHAPGGLLVPHVVRIARRCVLGLGPAAFPFDGERLRTTQLEAKARVERTGIPLCRFRKRPSLAVVDEPDAACPCAVGSPRDERGEPRQAGYGDVRRSGLPRRRGLQCEVSEPSAVRREVAALRIDHPCQPGAVLVLVAFEIPPPQPRPVARPARKNGRNGCTGRRDAEDARRRHRAEPGMDSRAFIVE